MRREELQAFLEIRSSKGRWTTNLPDLQSAFPCSPDVMAVSLHRLVKQRDLIRISPGVFAHPQAMALGKISLASLVGDLRPNDDCYITLDAALQVHGALRQAPRHVTVVTNGARYVYKTPLGEIQFIHSKRKPAQWRRGLSTVEINGVPVASMSLALSDYGRLGRPVPPPMHASCTSG